MSGGGLSSSSRTHSLCSPSKCFTVGKDLLAWRCALLIATFSSAACAPRKSFSVGKGFNACYPHLPFSYSDSARTTEIISLTFHRILRAHTTACGHSCSSWAERPANGTLNSGTAAASYFSNSLMWLEDKDPRTSDVSLTGHSLASEY